MRRPCTVFSVKKAYSTVSTTRMTSTFGRPRNCASFQPTKISAAETTRLRAQNSAAQALYLSLGFVQTGLRRNFYATPADDAVLMQKTL